MPLLTHQRLSVKLSVPVSVCPSARNRHSVAVGAGRLAGGPTGGSMSVPRRDADSPLLAGEPRTMQRRTGKVEKRSAGVPIGGGADSPTAKGSPHCPTDPLPAYGQPQPQPPRERAPKDRFSGRSPRRRGADLDPPGSRTAAAHTTHYLMSESGLPWRFEV